MLRVFRNWVSGAMGRERYGTLTASIINCLCKGDATNMVKCISANIQFRLYSVFYIPIDANVMGYRNTQGSCLPVQVLPIKPTLGGYQLPSLFISILLHQFFVLFNFHLSYPVFGPKCIYRFIHQAISFIPLLLTNMYQVFIQ